MFVQCAFRNARRSEVVESYAVEKIKSRVLQLVKKPVGIHVKFESDASGLTANCRVLAGNGESVNASHTADDFFRSVDGLVDKLAHQLRKKKDRRGTKSHARLVEISNESKRNSPVDLTFEVLDATEWDDWFNEPHH